MSEFDIEKTEEVYKRLVDKQDQLDDEDDFPYILKLEILKELYLLFNNRQHPSRANEISQLLKKLEETHTDVEFGYIYVLCLLNVNFDESHFEYSDVYEYISKVNEIEAKYEFTEDTLAEFELYKLYLYTFYFYNKNSL